MRWQIERKRKFTSLGDKTKKPKAVRAHKIWSDLFEKYVELGKRYVLITCTDVFLTTSIVHVFGEEDKEIYVSDTEKFFIEENRLKNNSKIKK